MAKMSHGGPTAFLLCGAELRVNLVILATTTSANSCGYSDVTLTASMILPNINPAMISTSNLEVGSNLVE